MRAGRRGERADPGRRADSAPRKTGPRHATDRRRQAVSGTGRRNRQHRFFRPRVYGDGLAEDRQSEPQHGPGRPRVGLDRAGGRQVRLHAGRWTARWRQKTQPAPHPAVVRQLEKRSFQLHAGMGESRPAAVPARPPQERQARGSALDPGRGQPGSRHARVYGLHAASEGSRHRAAHGAHDPIAERSGSHRRFARPVRPGRGCLRQAGAAGADGLSAKEQAGAVARSTQAVGGRGLEDRRHVAGSLWQVHRHRRDFHGVELRALHGPHGQGGQSRIRAAGFHQHVAGAAAGPGAGRLPVGLPGAAGDRRLEGRRALHRHQRAGCSSAQL